MKAMDMEASSQPGSSSRTAAGRASLLCCSDLQMTRVKTFEIYSVCLLLPKSWVDVLGGREGRADHHSWLLERLRCPLYSCLVNTPTASRLINTYKKTYHNITNECGLNYLWRYGEVKTGWSRLELCDASRKKTMSLSTLRCEKDWEKIQAMSRTEWEPAPFV